jgi:hypothetical protein
MESPSSCSHTSQRCLPLYIHDALIWISFLVHSLEYAVMEMQLYLAQEEFEDTKVVIRIWRQFMVNRYGCLNHRWAWICSVCRSHIAFLISSFYFLVFKVAKAVIRSLKSKKERVHNSQIERDKRTNNDPQNIRRKLKIEQHEPLYKSDVLS